jgi:archaellum component FlaG (FlaF/FlaG flagellin family)
METALISVVCIAILLIGTVTTMFTSFRAATKVSDSLKQWESQDSTIRRTDISATGSYSTGLITLWVKNTGQVNLQEFPKWDVIAEWTGDGTTHLNYLTNATSGPNDNEWMVQGIYLPDQTAPEVMDPNILNPQEVMNITLKLSPDMSISTTARITISTPNGITSQCLITLN